MVILLITTPKIRFKVKIILKLNFWNKNHKKVFPWYCIHLNFQLNHSLTVLGNIENYFCQYPLYWHLLCIENIYLTWWSRYLLTALRNVFLFRFLTSTSSKIFAFRSTICFSFCSVFGSRGSSQCLAHVTDVEKGLEQRVQNLFLKSTDASAPPKRQTFVISKRKFGHKKKQKTRNSRGLKRHQRLFHSVYYDLNSKMEYNKNQIKYLVTNRGNISHTSRLTGISRIPV